MNPPLLGQLRAGRSPTLEKLPLYRRVDMESWTSSLPEVATSSQNKVSNTWRSKTSAKPGLQPETCLSDSSLKGNHHLIWDVAHHLASVLLSDEE